MQFLSRLAKFWLVLTFAGTTGYFGYFNRERIEVALPPFNQSMQIPAYAAYIAFFGLGAIVTTVFLGLETFRKSFEIRALKKRLKEVEPAAVAQPTSDPGSRLRSPIIDPRAP